MADYHIFHCPVCGNKMDSFSFKFSLADIIEKIMDPSVNYVSGEYDEEACGRLVKEAKYFWNIGADDIGTFKENGMFKLQGKKLLCHFINREPNISRIYDELEKLSEENSSISDSLFGSVENSEATEKKNELKDLLFSKLPGREILQSELSAQAVKNKIGEIIDYALSGKLLFSADNITYTSEKDDNNYDIPTGIIIGGLYRAEIKKCSKCGGILPNHAGKFKQKIISFMGSPYSGKSAYLTSVISKLRHQGAKIGITINCDDTSPDYINFKNNLKAYEGGYSVTKTNQTEFPQISVDLSLGGSNGRVSKTYLYTFVDIPGEAFDLEISEDIKNKREIIKYSDILWYCLAAEQVFEDFASRENALDDDDSILSLLRETSSGSSISNKATDDLVELGGKILHFINTFFDINDKKPALVLILTKNDKISGLVSDVCSADAKNKANCEKFLCNIDNAEENAGEPWICKNVSDSAGVMIFENEDNIPPYSLIIDKFSKKSQRVNFVSSFLMKKGSSHFNAFYSAMKTAFGVSDIVNFSVASYGRDAYSFNLADTFEILFNYKEPSGFIINEILPEIKSIISEYPDSKLTDFLKEGKVSELKKIILRSLKSPKEEAEKKLKQQIERLFRDEGRKHTLYDNHMRFNGLNTFGILQPMVWSAAYTGLLPTAELVIDGTHTYFKPVPEDELSYVQDVLRLTEHKVKEEEPIHTPSDDSIMKKIFGLLGVKSRN